MLVVAAVKATNISIDVQSYSSFAAIPMSSQIDGGGNFMLQGIADGRVSIDAAISGQSNRRAPRIEHAEQRIVGDQLARLADQPAEHFAQAGLRLARHFHG